jgi:hypothetical protein
VLHEIESLDARDRYSPDQASSPRSSLGSLDSTQKQGAAMEKWESYSTIHSESDITTDYVAVAE